MIKLDKIIKIYNPKKANEYEALHGVSCEISDGEMVAIIGKSGAGKSTLVEDFYALENVLIPLDFAKKKIKNKKEKALEALKAVGMGDLSKKPCNKLSGGQKQRVAIARAIVNEPAMILADEPTGALDTKTSAEIMELFKSLNHEGKTIIIVTHDMNIAEQCDRVIEISDGYVVK